MAKLAMNAGEAFVFYRDKYEKGMANGNISDRESWRFGEYYSVVDDGGDEWLKRAQNYFCFDICTLLNKASSLDMTYRATIKHNKVIGFGYSGIGVLWGINEDLWANGDAGLSLTFDYTSATNLRIIFGVATAQVHGLDKLIPAYSLTRKDYARKRTVNIPVDTIRAQEIAASFDSKTRRLIVTVDGAEVINEIFSGSMGNTKFPNLEDWPTGYAGLFFGRDVQVKNLFLEFPTEGGEDEPEEEWRPLAEINRMGGDAPLFALLIESEGCEPLAIAQGYKDVWLKDANGAARLFTASGMTIELPERKAGSAAALNFGVADVSGEAMARCEQLRDSAHPVYVTCLEYASHGGKSSEDAPEPVWHLRLFGTSAAITPKGATFSAGWHDTLNAKYPYRRYTAAQFPGLKYVSSSL